MWRSRWRNCRSGIRWLSSATSAAARGHLADEGDWSYVSEWWSDGGDTVFRSVSDHGNGVVSVVAYPSSRPPAEQWPAVERSIQRRYEKLHPESEHDGRLKIVGYQWRVLRFNENTRQSTAKIMAAYRNSDPSSLFLMQQPHCLAVPYLKSMVSAGLTALASSGYDLSGAVTGKRSMKILCVGHGGGSLPLFLASKIKGASVHIVEIDPVVVMASVQAMGFPASAVTETSDKLSFDQSSYVDEVLWERMHERLFLHRSDAEDFVLNCRDIYDLVFIDAYDGDDIFPHKLWDRQGPFLESLRSKVHPVHGTVVVNLHSDSEVLSMDMKDYSLCQSILPMSRYISQVRKAYEEHFGLAFFFSVPWLCNITLVACSGMGLGINGRELDKNLVLNALISKCYLVEFVLGLPFPCLPYIKRGFMSFD
ncbi:hypothetical protein MUK42_29756 [Musa troglodytarum]|uniref:S-adenosyl-L-methionine-dependent methyltransferase superfamily protein n=1 Tax=Musa troglodytarum TaxID=320322 RepID=A0A9E7FPD0_9LILI|nr:hypothetical protein MUK42_29756 [Musa troglodytarum]